MILKNLLLFFSGSQGQQADGGEVGRESATKDWFCNAKSLQGGRGKMTSTAPATDRPDQRSYYMV